MISTVKQLIPPPLRRQIKSYLAARQKARLFGSLAPLVPQVEEMFDGPRSLEQFKANGEEFLRIYKELCGLRPDETMLDVGCGIGRKTLPLTQYLTANARYEGMDITSAGIAWCGSRITPRFPNFRFQQIDVYNKHYNPQGTCPPSQYRFPFESNTFSFVMLGSVFTHMLPADLSNYLSEVHRVMQVGGRCLISYFLLNDESLRQVEAGRSSHDFKYVEEGYRTTDRLMPELAIAFDEDWITDQYRRLGLEVVRLEHGAWYGQARNLSYQDLIFAVKA